MSTMTPAERRSSLALTLVFALRMLGLFLVLPVFSLAASDYRGGDDPRLIGLAMGAYGLTQAFLQWPLGVASDWLGRRRVIVAGLLVFAGGSVVAALADSVWELVIGRAVQGAGAISAATVALLADLTRDAVRTKAMALIGIGIGASFALALVLGPLLGAYIGLSGLFWLVAALALLAMVAVLTIVPAQPSPEVQAETAAAIAASAADPGEQARAQAGLWRLYLGVFLLHCLQMAMWSGVPQALEAAGLLRQSHWQLYLPAVGISIVFLGAVFSLERRGRLASVMLWAVALILLAQLALAALAFFAGGGTGAPTLWAYGLVLFVFFCGFNTLEASQPSQVSRLASPARRGAAMGIYSMLQSLGLFLGGVLGGLLVAHGGRLGLFSATAALGALWLIVAWTAPRHTQRRL